MNNNLGINPDVLERLKNINMNNIANIHEIDTGNRQLQEITEQLSKERQEKKSREIRMLEISEERLTYDKFKIFLLQSVNKEQKEMLERLDSLIDTIEFGDKVVEGNLAIIEQELLDIKQSTDNLNESFIKFIQKKMMEMGVEVAAKCFFIGIKELFLKP